MKFRIWFKLWIRYFYLLFLGRPRPKKRRRKTDRERGGRCKRKGSRYSVDKQRSRRIKEGIRRRNVNYEAFVRSMSICVAFFAVVILLPVAVADWTAKSIRKQSAVHRRTGVSGSSVKNKKSDKVLPVSQKTVLIDRKNEQNGCRVLNAGGCISGKTYDGEFAYVEAYGKASVIRGEFDGSEVEEKYMPHDSRDTRISKRLHAVSDLPSPSVGIGEYFDIVIDDGKIVLRRSEEVFAVVTKEDAIPIDVTLRLKRRIYGVVCNVTRGCEGFLYEFDAWIDAKS